MEGLNPTKCRTLLENLQCDSKIVGARPNLAPISHDASSLLLTISYGHEVFQFSFDYSLVEILLGQQKKMKIIKLRTEHFLEKLWQTDYKIEQEIVPKVASDIQYLQNWTRKWVQNFLQNNPRFIPWYWQIVPKIVSYIFCKIATKFTMKLSPKFFLHWPPNFPWKFPRICIQNCPQNRP